MKLQSKKAIVTGANRSIGKAIARAFAQEGADVVISYNTDKDGASEVVKMIQTMGRRSTAIQSNFAEMKEVEDFFTKALEFLGNIDILVNNAAGYDTSPFLDLKNEAFHNNLKVGVVAPMFLTQLTARHMVEKKILGNIINISSISGSRPYINRVSNSTTKSALNMLTKATALELAPFGIRINAIAPGNTPYDESSLEGESEIPLKRLGKVNDHANIAVYLASEEASWITGQIVTVDGGQSLR